MRWPEDEIGRNSVMPWIRASTTICTKVIVAIFPESNRLAACGLGSYTAAHGSAIAILTILAFIMASLIHFPLDPLCRRMRLALGEYGMVADMIEEFPWDPSHDILSLNPAGTLPIYAESAEILICSQEAVGEYLEDTRGAGASLIPGSAVQRAEVRRLTSWFDTRFNADATEPLLTEKIVRRFLSPAQGGGGPEMNRIRLAKTRMRPHLDYVSKLADGSIWLAGDALSLADLAAAAHLSVIDYLGDVPWADYPLVKSWYQRIKSRPSFRPLLGDNLRGVAPSASYPDLDF